MKNAGCYKYLHLFNDSLVLKMSADANFIFIPFTFIQDRRQHFITDLYAFLRIFFIHNFDVSFFKNTVYIYIERKKRHFQILPVLFSSYSNCFSFFLSLLNKFIPTSLLLNQSIWSILFENKNWLFVHFDHFGLNPAYTFYTCWSSYRMHIQSKKRRD